MKDIPKVVPERLRRATPATADAHPDADLLTAFAERSLAGREQEQVMEHLARCGDCREVVALALPASEAAVLPGVVTAGRHGWLSWPVLRWGVVAAGVILVASVGVLQYRHRHQQNGQLVSSVMRGNEMPAPAARKLASSPPAVLPPAHSAQDELRKKADLRMKSAPGARGALSADQPSPPADAVFPQPTVRARSAGTAGKIGGGVGGGAGPGSDQSSGTAGIGPRRDSLAFAPAPASEATVALMAKQNASRKPGRHVEVSSASETVQAQPNAATAESEKQKTQPSQNHSVTDFDIVGKAKEPVPAQAPPPSDALDSAPPAVALQSSALMRHASPRWTISSTGALQRSFDGGNTWEDVDVASTSPPSPSQSRSLAGNEYKRTQKEKEKTQSNSSPVFRAVAAIGPEVWAGGSGATLYHSADSGAHWTRVLPSAAGIPLAGDITAIEFSDPQQGRITTSTGEAWITTDDGQTWQKQQ